MLKEIKRPKVFEDEIRKTKKARICYGFTKFVKLLGENKISKNEFRVNMLRLIKNKSKKIFKKTNLDFIRNFKNIPKTGGDTQILGRYPQEF